MLPSLAALHAQAQQNRIEFLKTDLALCFTFADLFETELRMGDMEAAHQLKQKAEHGYDTITRLLVGVDDATEKGQIQQGLNELRVRLDGFEALPQPATI
jgi:hypothetical protein